MEVSWKGRLLHSMEMNTKSTVHPHYYQLATIRSDGRCPAVRTVAHRSFYGDSGLTVLTDSRSTKMEEIRSHPCVEVCWFFEGSREQYRLCGKATLIDGSHKDTGLQQERQKVWSGVAPEIRAYMSFPSPGQPRITGCEELSKTPAPSADSKPAENMVLLLIDMEQAEWLNVPENRRVLYQRSVRSDGKQQWDEQELNP